VLTVLFISDKCVNGYFYFGPAQFNADKLLVSLSMVVQCVLLNERATVRTILVVVFVKRFLLISTYNFEIASHNWYQSSPS